MPSPRPLPPIVSSILTPILTPHATASVAVLALAVALREQVMSSGAPSAATMANWEPLALCAAAGSVAARVISRGAGLAGALPIAARVAQLTACSLLFTASPAAGAWLVAAAGAAAALVPWSSAEEEATFGALPATTPAAVTETVGGPDKLVLVLYDPAGGSRTDAAVAALAAYAARVKGGSVRTDGGRGGGGRPPTFARLDAARWPEVVGALAGCEEPVALPAVVVWEGGKVKVDVTRISRNLQSFIIDSMASSAEKSPEKPIAVVGKEALTIIRRFQRTDKTNRKVLISEDAIKSVFHLPISKAANELGVGLTVLKKYCRVYSISRWPFRKIKSLDKLVSTVTAINDLNSVDTRSAVAQGLVNKKLAMELMPSIELDIEIKRIRQAAYKLEHKKRRLSSAAEKQRQPGAGEQGATADGAATKAPGEGEVVG